MTSFPAHFIFALRRSRVALLALLCPLVLPIVTRAQEAPKQEKFYLSDKISEELGKIRPLADAKKLDEALAALDVLIKTAAPNSFDYVSLCTFKFQFLLQKGDNAKAIEPMESALTLSQQYHYLDESVELDITLYLAQIYLLETQAKGRTAEQQKQDFTKAAKYAESYIQRSRKPAVDHYYLYAQILYYWAMSVPDKTDKELLKKSRAQVEKGLLLATHPKEQQFQLLLAILLQEGNFAGSAEYLELLVKQHPNGKNYWQQLVQIYFSLASDKDVKKAYENNVRAIVTMERAQTLGLLNTPKDNFNLVGAYINIQQYERATDLLQAGLRNGTIENEQKNWEYLAMCFQELNRELKAIEVIKEATTHFPKSGSLHFLIAQLYAQIDKQEQAYGEGMKALEIGNLDRPGAVYCMLTYWAFDLRKFDEALAAVTKAYEYPEAKKDPQLARVKAAILDAIKERDFLKSMNETPPQQPAAEQKKQPEPKKQSEMKQPKSV